MLPVSIPVRAFPKILIAPAVTGQDLARLHWVSIFLLATSYVSALVALITKSDANWPEAGLLLLGTLSTIFSLSRQLPAQNVFLASLILAFGGSLAHALGAKCGIPFGPFMFGAGAGWKLFGELPWMIPFLWVAAVLNSRGVARLILRPWRKIRAYGLWLIALTALLTVLFDCALEPFAMQVRHYWIWAPGGYSLTPQGAPLANSAGWLLVTLLMLAFVTPLLINKQLSKRSAPDFHPLAVWLGAILLFGLGAALKQLWEAVVVDAVIGVATAVFAIRGARW